MSLVNTLLVGGGAFFNLGVRILYIPLAIFSWLGIVAQSWKMVLTLLIVGLAFYGIGRHGSPVIATVINTMNTVVAPVWQNDVAPILGPIRDFTNAFICFYDGFIIFPYATGRNQIFPILKDGGFGTMMISFGQFVAQCGKDFFLNYFVSGHFLAREFDYGPIFEKWQSFFRNWQALWCYGCNDLCPIYRNLPILLGGLLTSDQYVDVEFGHFLGKTFNACMLAVQQVIYIVREFIWPSQTTLPRANFSRTFQLLCQGQHSLRVSTENIMQQFWNSFIPYPFVWEDFFSFFDTINCLALSSAELSLNMVIHSDDVLKHFTRKDSTYWKESVKEDFKAIINLLGPATYFEDIPLIETTISSYQILTQDQAKPNGKPNPIYNLLTVGECFCIALNRLICDPQANGTTCEQQYNGTLLSGIDVCCFTRQGGELAANSLAFLFEFSLHFVSVNDFIQYLDKQPLGRNIRTSMAKTMNCFWMFFRIIKDYGYCVERIFAELTIFVVYSGELILRILIALLTVPYYNKFLPDDCNFITCSGDEPLNTALFYLNQISNTSNRDGLSNCFCYVLNNGFNVPFAGCGGTACKPSGYLEPSNVSHTLYPKRHGDNDEYSRYFTTSVYDLMSKTGEFSNSIYKSKNVRFTGDISKYRKAGAAFQSSFDLFDKRFHDFATKVGKCSSISDDGSRQQCAVPRTLIYLNDTENTISINCTNTTNPTPNPVPCFGLCCLPVKLIDIASHVIAFGARGLNAAFQTRYGDGSGYWDGTTCLLGSPCLSSDITMLVVKAIAPIDCLCQFIKLFLPSQGFGDPCCAFHVLGELISCFIQILINIGNSIAGDPDFIYIKGDVEIMNEMNVTTYDRMEPQMIYDFDIVLGLALRLFDCICDFVRTIVSVAFNGNQIFKAFDPCCVIRVAFRAILECVRLALRVVLVLSTLESKESQCYIFVNDVYNSRPGCHYGVEELGIVRQFREIVKIIFAPPTFDVTQYCSSASSAAALPNITSLIDQNQEGVATCACNMANALLSMVFMITGDFKGDLSATPKCSVNLCCPIYGVGKVMYNVAYTLVQVIATLWQNWRMVRVPLTTLDVFVPQETLNYFFCDEYGPDASYTFTDYSGINITVPNPGIYPGYANSVISNHAIFAHVANSNGTAGIVNPNMISRAKCGQLEPALQALVNVMGKCLCTAAGNGIINILDDLLAWMIAFASTNSIIFPKPITWPQCLCKGGPKKQCQVPTSSGFRLSPAPPRGITIPFTNALVVLLRQIIILVRNIANPTMWAPAGGTLTDPNYAIQSLIDNYADIKLTWVNRFLAPLADSLAVLVVNIGCTLNMVLGNSCIEPRYDLLASLSRYVFEAIIRLGSILEGAIKMFTQEPPGLCVGGAQTNGNAFDPSQQGTSGENGVLVPTCSQKSAGGQTFFGDVNSGIGAGGRNTGHIGRILNSAFTFIIDALIGVSRLGCTVICPSFDIEKVFKSFNEWTELGMENVDAVNSCECWNRSPYTNLVDGGGEVCSFEQCDLYFNSGYSILFPENPDSYFAQNLFSCPGGRSFCTKEEAMGPPNTGTPFNVTYQDLLNQGGCSRGCSNDPEVVLPGQKAQFPLKAESWGTFFPQFKFRPVADKTQATGLRCEITEPTFHTNAAAVLMASYMGKVIPKTEPLVLNDNFLRNKVYPLLGTTFNLTQLGTELLCDSNFALKYMNGDHNNYMTLFAEATPYFGSCFLASLCGDPVEWVKWHYDRSMIDRNGVCGTLGSVFPRDWPSYAYKITRSPIGTACMACRIGVKFGLQYSGTEFEDAHIRPLCTKETCLVTQRLCKNEQMVPCVPGGLPLDGVIIAGVKYFSCVMRFVFGNFPANIFEAIGALLVWIWQISGGIIRLAVYFMVYVAAIMFELSKGGIHILNVLLSFVPLTINGLVLFGEIFGQSAVAGYKRDIPVQFDDAHDCIETELCMCRIFNLQCSENTTITEMLTSVRDHFGNPATSCGILIQYLIGLNVTKWSDVQFSERYEFTDCIAKRTQGEYVSRVTDYSVPADIFYNVATVYTWLMKVLGATSVTHKEERVPIVNRFKKNFFISRDHFGKLINSRGNRLRKYYTEVHHMSIGVWPMMQIELFHYKYMTGYYHFLYDELSWGRFQENLGTPTENLRILKEEFSHVSGNIKTVTTSTMAKVKDMINLDYIPELNWPTFDTSLFRNIKEQFHFPSIRFNTPELEKISLVRSGRQDRPHLNAVKRILSSVSHKIWPHSTTKEHHDKFIVGGSCRIVDGVITEGSKIVDYCLNDAARNIDSIEKYVGGYLNKTSHLRGGFHQDFAGRLNYTTTGSGSWKRPKVVYKEQNQENKFVHRDMYHRAHAHRFDPTFAFFNLFGFDIIQNLDTYYERFKYWMNNKNMEHTDRPDVGAKYWLQHMAVCDFPTSLDCSFGIGLADALKQVGLIYLIAFFVISLMFPSVLSLLSFIFNILMFLLIVSVVAFNYSPACIALFPTSTLGSTVYTIPILPIPLNIFPAIPFCLWDEVLSIVDSVFASCYDWIPQSILNNDKCGSEPVSLPDCNTVGIQSPLEVLIYFARTYIGSVTCDILIPVTSLVPFFGSASTTCHALANASTTQAERQTLCAWMNIGILAWVLLFFYLIATFITTVVLAIIGVLHAVILLIPLLPFYDALVGMGTAQGVFLIQNEDEQEEAKEEEEPQIISAEFKPRTVGIIDKIANLFITREKQEKLE